MKKLFALFVLSSFVCSQQLRADSFTGVYDDGVGFGSQTTGTGPWQLTSTDSTYSYIGLITNEHPTFASLTNLNAVFNSPIFNALETQAPINAGAGGGAPRLSVELSQGAVDANLHIYFGTSPSYNDGPLLLNAYSGVNLIGNNDAGRYDTSQFAGGSPFTTYSSALALLGSYQVQSIYVVLDSFGGADKTLDVTSFGGDFEAPTPTPEPATVVTLLGMGVAATVWMGLRSRKV